MIDYIPISFYFCELSQKNQQNEQNGKVKYSYVKFGSEVSISLYFFCNTGQIL